MADFNLSPYADKARLTPICLLVNKDGTIGQNTDPTITVARQSTGVYKVFCALQMGLYSLSACVSETSAHYATVINGDAGGLDPGFFFVVTFANATAGAEDAAFTLTINKLDGPIGLFAGDSLTVGNHAAPGDSTGGSRFVVTDDMRKNGKLMLTAGPCFVGQGPQGGFHRGIAGETMQSIISGGSAGGGLPEIGFLYAKAKPRASTLAWGVNDMANGATVNQMLGYAEQILNAARQASQKTYFAFESICVPGAGAAGGYGANRAIGTAFNVALPLWCAQHQIDFIDRGTPEQAADQIHLTTNGYAAVGAIEYAWYSRFF